MTFRSLARASALALFAVLLVTGAVKAIDLTTDMGGFSGGQITGLRDTFVDQLNTETIAGNKTLTGTTVISGATTVSGTFDATSTFSLGGTAVTATAAEINAAADVSARVVTITGTSSMTAAANADRINMLAEVGGNAEVEVSLPAATGTGDRYKFYIGVVNTSNYIVYAATTDTMSGSVSMLQDDAANAYIAFEISGTDDKLLMNGTTTGGVTIGDWVELVDCLSTVWCVTGVLSGSGTEVIPASSS